jgi:hypothetical protein
MKWRPRDEASVVVEIRGLVERYGAKSFWFVDDEFLGPPGRSAQRLLNFARLLGPLGVEFGFDARADAVAALTPSLLAVLRGAGLRVVSMGIESGSQRQLDRMGKGLRVEANLRAIEALRAAGLDYRFGFIMYDRGTTREDLRDNLAFLRFAGPQRICNTGPFRLLNAEFPEIGSRLYRALGIRSPQFASDTPPDLPRLSEEQLGYRIHDRSVARHRALLRSLALAVVEPRMVARSLGPNSAPQDIWFGPNLLARNVAAMNAFLDCHQWLLDRLDERLDDHDALAALSAVFIQALWRREQELRPCPS